MADGGDDLDWVFQNHPDLVDGEWARRTAKLARREARRAARRRARPALGASGVRSIRFRSIVAVIVVMVGALVVTRHPWSSPAVVRSLSPVPPSVTPGVRRTDLPLDLNAPFGRTPAAGWSDGAAGIVPPAATAVGRYSAAQVATAVNLVKQVLVASHLDSKMLVGHDTSTYLSLLAPDDRAQEQKALTDPAHTPDRGGGLTLLANGFHLLPAPAKVNGSMSVGVAADGELAIHTNYVFAFPFAPADPRKITQPWQIVAVQHVAEDFEYVADKRMTSGSQGLFVRGTQGYYDSMACDQSTKGFLAPAYADPSRHGPPDTSGPDAYYDPNHDLNVPNGC